MVVRMRDVMFVALALVLCGSNARGAETVQHPFLGVTHVTRTETSPRSVTMHIVQIDLGIPGVRVRLTPPGGTLETERQTTLAYLEQQQAQIAINGHFFLPFPSSSPYASLIGLAASDGVVYSAFEAPVQSYALVTNAAALNIDPANRAGIVHVDPAVTTGTIVLEPVMLWNAIAGSAQIVTNGVKTVPQYLDAQHPDGLLTPGGSANYSNANSWYNLFNARTAIGLSQDGHVLTLFTVDRAAGSLGLSVGEVADILVRDYGVYNALNLDGGGSTTLAIEDPATHVRAIANVSSDNPAGRSVGSNLAVFADLDAIAPVTAARATPRANRYGWSNTPVTVSLTATDNPGGWVAGIVTALAGAQTAGPDTATGAAASRTITAEGLTTLSYFATDAGGNQEAEETLTLAVDMTPPVLVGLPAGSCPASRHDDDWHLVARVRASDALSGVAPHSLRVTATTNRHTQRRAAATVVVPDGGGGFKVLARSGDDRREDVVVTMAAAAADRAGNSTAANATCVMHAGGRRPHHRR